MFGFGKKERMDCLALVPVLVLSVIWMVSCGYMQTNFSSGKRILTGSKINLEAKFFPSLNSTARYQGVLYVAEPLDACQNLSNKPEQSPNGTPPFVLIVRGGCSFEEKVRNAERAGFKAAIVHDDVHRDILVPSKLMFSETNNSEIKIDAAFVSKASGETLNMYASLGQSNAKVLLVPGLNNRVVVLLLLPM